MDYHEYRNTVDPYRWRSIAVQCQMKPDNDDVDKYAVAVMNKDRVVGHLIKGKN